MNKCCSARQAATWSNKRAENKRDVEILICFSLFKPPEQLDTSFQVFLLARSFCLEIGCFFRINRDRSLTSAANIRWPALRVGTLVLLISSVFLDSSSRVAKRAYANFVSPKTPLWSSPTLQHIWGWPSHLPSCTQIISWTLTGCQTRLYFCILVCDGNFIYYFPLFDKKS